ncbi:MAG: hypothetical protein H6672_15245 [Anaerolineaceae bacterium]|nr:hypothetical protein [Anaerolineaceae bacterium]
MPVLLLAQGDNEAKDMLRSAIEARYGLQPPGLESLRIDFKGRTRVKVGPITTWVPIEATAHFLFPTSLRWDATIRPVGIAVQKVTETFDGTVYRTVRGGNPATIISDEDAIQSMQHRLWAIAAVLLTPLGEMFVSLVRKEDFAFEALNTEIHAAATLSLRENNTLHTVSVRCLNPDTGQKQNFIVRLSEEQSPVDDFMLPCKISAFWDDSPYFEVEPVGVQSNPEITPEVFTLSDNRS